MNLIIKLMVILILSTASINFSFGQLSDIPKTHLIQYSITPNTENVRGIEKFKPKKNKPKNRNRQRDRQRLKEELTQNCGEHLVEFVLRVGLSLLFKL